MYLFWWPRVTFAKSDLPPLYLGTVLLQWLQWYLCSDLSWPFHCIFITNPWCSSYHAYKPITIAQTWQLSFNGNSTNNLLRGYRCFRSTLVQNSSFTTRNQLVETLPLLPFKICPKLLQKEPTTCQEAAVPLLPFGTHPKLLHMTEAFPACTCTKLQYSYMMKRPSQLPVLLLQPFWWWSTWPPQQARRDRTCIQNINVLSICSTSANVIFIFNMYKWEISRVHGHTIRIAYFS